MIQYLDMRHDRLSLLVVLLFGVLLIGASLLNIYFISTSREELTKTILLNPSSVKKYDHLIIGILPQPSDPFIANLYKGIQSTAEKYHQALQFFTYDMGSTVSTVPLSPEAYRYFEIALRVKPEGIIMFFPAGMNIGDFINQARAKDIPFVGVAMDVPPLPEARFITSDSASHGKAATIQALQTLGTHARLGIILPSRSSEIIQEDPFLRGALEAIQETGYGRIIATEREEENILAGEGAASRLLQDHPEINAILCTSARSTIGAAQVLIDRGLVGKILIIGADENEEIIRLLEKGVVSVTLVRDAFRMGVLAIETLTSIKKGTYKGEILRVTTNIKRHGN